VLLLTQLLGFVLLQKHQGLRPPGLNTIAMAEDDQTEVEEAAAALGRELDDVARAVDRLALAASDIEGHQALLAGPGQRELEANSIIKAIGITQIGDPWLLQGLLRVGHVLVPTAQNVPELVEYTPDSAWFHLAKVDGAGWHRPQSFQLTNELVIIYSTPICVDGPCDKTSEEPFAVFSAMVNLRDLETAARELDLGAGADTLIVSNDGDLVVHSRMDLVRKGMTAHELAWRSGDADLSEALAEIGRGEAGIVGPREDPQTGRQEYLSWRTFGTGRDGVETHALIAHVPIHDPMSQTDRRHTAVLQLAVGVPFCLTILLLMMLLVLRDRQQAAWTTSGLLAGTAIVMIAGLWWAAAKHPTPPTPGDQPILSSADLAGFEREWTQASKNPRFESLGLFLQSIEFQSANNVTISGIAWQRFPAEDCEVALATEPEPRFFFPEADPGEELQISLAYHQCDGLRKEVLHGWRFRALLRQDFDYLLYPFDPQELWVRLLPVEFDKNVVLVPDLLSYDRTARESTPGLDRELILPGWDLVGSGFAYRRRAYNTDFGVNNYVGQSDFPELVYTVSLRRSFLGPFVGKVIPLGVAAAMLFCMLLLGTRNTDYEGAFGFSAMEVVMGAAALFFVVIFDHSALRDDLATTKPFYLEYFYFVMYLALVGVCANAIAFAMQRGHLVRFQDNLVPKLLFWPLYLGAIALITVAIFW
jgi:hypothetical protein